MSSQIRLRSYQIHVITNVIRTSEDLKTSMKPCSVCNFMYTKVLIECAAVHPMSNNTALKHMLGSMLSVGLVSDGSSKGN